MTEAELKAYITRHFPKENESCEWKQFSNLTHSISGRKGDDAISYASAIANVEGGHMVIGVEDKTLDIKGINNFHDYTPENLPHRLMGNCTNLVSEGLKVESYSTSDTHKTVWIIHIPKHSPRKPVFAHKTAWQRKGDALIPITPKRENVILNESIGKVFDWSAVVVENASLQDLEPSALAKARGQFKNKFPLLATEVDAWDDITFLNKAKLTIKGKLTRTAILLLGKPEAEHFINPAEAKISWILKDSKGNERDYQIFTCPFLLAVDGVFSKIRNLKYRYIRDQSLFPEEVDMYEPYIIREALNNCIAHQDYEQGGRINVVEFDDELVFSNLGSFIPGTLEKVIEQDAPEETYRNPFLVTAMFNLIMVDTIGSGIRRMFSFQRQKFFPMPEYDLSKGKVKVTITGKVIDLEYARTLAQNPDLTLEEIMLLDKVQKKKNISDQQAASLKAKKLIEGRKPNFHISANIAETTGQKAEYIKNRAFKDQHYKNLILEFIDRYGACTKEDVDRLILDILPAVLDNDQKKNKVRNILYAMSKREQTIVNQGTNRNPIWKKNV